MWEGRREEGRGRVVRGGTAAAPARRNAITFSITSSWSCPGPLRQHLLPRMLSVLSQGNMMDGRVSWDHNALAALLITTVSSNFT